MEPLSRPNITENQQRIWSHPPQGTGVIEPSTRGKKKRDGHETSRDAKAAKQIKWQKAEERKKGLDWPSGLEREKKKVRKVPRWVSEQEIKK